MLSMPKNVDRFEERKSTVCLVLYIPRIEFDPAGTQKAVSFETCSGCVRAFFARVTTLHRVFIESLSTFVNKNSIRPRASLEGEKKPSRILG